MDRLIRFPRLWLLLSRLCHVVYREGAQRSEALRLEADLRSDIAAGRTVRSIEDHYRAGAGERDRWLYYQSLFLGSEREAREEIFRNRAIRDAVLRLRPSRFINFGCLYGWLEDQLGQAGIDAHGIDRSAETKSLNEAAFPGAKFHAADIMEFLAQNAQLARNAMLAHINTGVYFLPAFLTRLYETAYASGMEAVLVWEPWGRSRLDAKYYVMDPERDQPPKVFRGPMLLHNYARLLKRAGYASIVHQEIVRPPHPHPDFRSLFLVAKRQPGPS